ncbi:MAG: hypothetical protein WBB34_13525 [Xanthobacteraceae bacterium]
MTRTIWLASYPKSGNTWFRMLVANLSATDKPVDINDLPERGGIASARGPFDHLTLIDSGLLKSGYARLGVRKAGIAASRGAIRRRTVKSATCTLHGLGHRCRSWAALPRPRLG